MFTLSIDINGTQIRRIDAVNTGETEDHEFCTLTRYRVLDYDFEAGRVRRGEVWHDPDDGAEGLLSGIAYDVYTDAVVNDDD